MTKTKRSKTRRTRSVVVVALVIIVALVAFFVYRGVRGSADVQVTYTTQAAEKMTLLSSVSGIGNVSLTSSRTVDPGISGEVADLNVKLGDAVEEGQPLFTMVNAELDLAVTNAENSLAQAHDSLERAQLAVLQAEQTVADLEEQYETQSTSATVQPTTTTRPPSTTVTLPPTTQSTTTTTFAPTTTTTSTPPATTTSLATTTTLLTTTTEISASRTGYLVAADSVKLTSQDAQTTQTTQVGQANAAAGSTVTLLDIEVARQQVTSSQTSIKVAEAQVVSAEMALEAAKANAAKRQVKAPTSGTITALNIENGDSVGGATGSTGTTGQAAAGSATSSSTTSSETMVITNLGSFEATVVLAEGDIVRVEVGQKATITFDALADLEMTGKVSRIGAEGTNNQGVVTYDVIIVPDISNVLVKGGMTVSVNIITQVTPDVLAVPNSAVKSQIGGGSYVQALENGAPVNVTVEVGTSTDSYTEIISGLSEGQEVVTQTSSSSSAASGTQSNGNSLLPGTGGVPGAGGGRPPGF
ncbi:MAG: biotin/lipoyl-binding protein [bacterium]